MFLLRKILAKFTPKLNELHLTTITLFKPNFNKIYSQLRHSLAMAWLQWHYFCVISVDF